MIPKLFISPSLETRVGELLREASLSSGNLNIKTHPDVLYFAADEKLGIEQSRQIKEHFSTKPYQAEGRVLVIEQARDLTAEAQNALLKIFEEAPEKAVIILGAKSEQDLLPTILSRCHIIQLKNPTSHRNPTSEVGYYEDIQKLLNSTLEERFEYIEKLKEREEFLHALVGYFREMLHAPRGRLGGYNVKEFLKELLEAEKWAAQNVNLRAILEYLMLVMPRATS